MRKSILGTICKASLSLHQPVVDCSFKAQRLPQIGQISWCILYTHPLLIVVNLNYVRHLTQLHIYPCSNVACTVDLFFSLFIFPSPALLPLPFLPYGHPAHFPFAAARQGNGLRRNGAVVGYARPQCCCMYQSGCGAGPWMAFIPPFPCSQASYLVSWRPFFPFLFFLLFSCPDITILVDWA